MSEVAEMMDKIGKGLEQFKADCKGRLDEMESHLKGIESRSNRPGADSNSRFLNADQIAHKAAFVQWARKGNDDGLEELERKALNVTTSADGGYAVPEELDRTITNLMTNEASLRSLADIVQVGTGDYKTLVNIRGTAATWVGETSSRPETDTPQLAEVVPPIGEIYANPATTQRMLDDAFFDAGEWLANEVGRQFSLAEATAFVSGNGTNRPKGFLTYTINTSSDGARSFGDLQMIKTGIAGGFISTTTSSNPADSFISAIHSLAPPYRAGASWAMNSSTLEAVRKFRDADGNYLWRPGLEAGAPGLLLGYPVSELPDMPDVATNTYPIAFGNWKAGYRIVDRTATRVLRDPFTNKPYVQFYTTRRVGGAVVDSNAIKLVATRT